MLLPLGYLLNLVVYLFLVCFRVYNRMNWKERDTSFTIMSLYILFLFFSNRGKDAIFPQLIIKIMKHSTQYEQDTKMAVGEEWNGPFHHPIPLKSHKWRNGRVSSFLSPFLPTQNKLVVKIQTTLTSKFYIHIKNIPTWNYSLLPFQYIHSVSNHTA